MQFDPHLVSIMNEQPYPLLFATISGAHLYGFPSPNSDYDLRGVHILPAVEMLGLEPKHETLQTDRVIDGLEIDLVTHDTKKFFQMLLKRNGYVLEQLYSPLILLTTPEHQTLKAIANGCITHHHGQHYLGFSENQWKLFVKETPCRLKPLLYVYRVLLTGIHLMRTGKVEANLLQLNEIFNLPYIPDLVAKKLVSAENSILADADVIFHQREYERLRKELEVAIETSGLPELPTARTLLNDLLIQVRVDNQWREIG